MRRSAAVICALILLSAAIMLMAGCSGDNAALTGDEMDTAGAGSPWAGRYYGSAVTGTQGLELALGARIASGTSIFVSALGQGLANAYPSTGTVAVGGATTFSIKVRKEGVIGTYSFTGTFTGTAGKRRASGTWTSTFGGSGTWSLRLAAGSYNTGEVEIVPEVGAPYFWNYKNAYALKATTGGGTVLCVFFDNLAIPSPFEAGFVVDNADAVGVGELLDTNMAWLSLSKHPSDRYVNRNSEPQLTFSGYGYSPGNTLSGNITGSLYTATSSINIMCNFSNVRVIADITPVP